MFDISEFPNFVVYQALSTCLEYREDGEFYPDITVQRLAEYQHMDADLAEKALSEALQSGNAIQQGDAFLPSEKFIKDQEEGMKNVRRAFEKDAERYGGRPKNS